jgi:TldD protein
LSLSFKKNDLSSSQKKDKRSVWRYDLIMETADKETTIEAMKTLIARIPSKFYADVLYDATSSLTISKSISDENISVLPKVSGFVCRIFDGDRWWEIGDPDILQIETRLSRLLPKLEFSDHLTLTSIPAHRLDHELPMKVPLDSISLENKLDRLRSIYDIMRKCDSRVINPRISYRDGLLERIFVNNEGSILRQIIPRTRLMIMPIVREGGSIEYDYQIVAKEAGFECVDDFTSERIEKSVQNAIEFLGAKLPPSGAMPVILDPAMSGLIAHESMGHGLEADQVIRDRSYLKDEHSKSVASSIVSISDSPVIPGEIGSYIFDEEGIVAKKTPLVENGVLTHYLHTRLSASILHEEPRGNGRRQSYRHPVYPRMTNTFFEPGDMKLDEMIRDMKSGVMILKSNFGMEDPLGGGMQVGSKYGYLIENGEKTALLKAITLSGSVLDFLKEIDGVSMGPMLLDGGQCGKGVEDFVYVTSGGVWIRSKKGIVGPG